MSAWHRRIGTLHPRPTCGARGTATERLTDNPDEVTCQRCLAATEDRVQFNEIGAKFFETFEIGAIMQRGGPVSRTERLAVTASLYPPDQPLDRGVVDDPPQWALIEQNDDRRWLTVWDEAEDAIRYADGRYTADGRPPELLRILDLDTGDWYRTPTIAEAPTKLGRNDPCWCGSGNKYKRCHEKADQARNN